MTDKDEKDIDKEIDDDDGKKPESKEFEGRFQVDTEGFKNQMAEMKPYQLVQEIIANSMDESSVTRIDTTIKFNLAKKVVEVSVLDNGDGFRTIHDVFKLFGRSYKRAYKNLRGRFNLGEKEFMAVTIDGFVRSRDWKVEFFDDKRREITGIEPFKGTEVFGTFDWSKTTIAEMEKELVRIIVPHGQDLYINGDLVAKKPMVRSINGKLWTEVEDELSGKMTRELHDAQVDLYERKEGETAWIFELGIPVQQLEKKLNVKWHFDVRQKVPLGIKRDVVSDSYLVDLYALVVNEAHDLIPQEDAGASWITRSMGKLNAEPAKALLTKQYGTEKLYIPSTSDFHANEAVNNINGAFILPRTLDKDQRQHLIDMGVIQYASDAFGSKTVGSEPVQPTEKMLKYAQIVKVIARDVIGKDITVSFVRSEATHSAWYGINDLTYNLKYLSGGEKFFDQFSAEGWGLIVHELSHDKSPNQGEYPMPHASKEFLSEFQRISGFLILKGKESYLSKYPEFTEAKT